MLAARPAAGREYAHVRSVRRLLLPHSRYHVYYRFDARAGVVYVSAVWHCSRGSGREP